MNLTTQILVRTADAAGRSDNPNEANLSRLLHGTAAAIVHGTTDLAPSEVEHWTHWAEQVSKRDHELLTGGELLDLAAKERRSALRSVVFDLSGLGTWNGAQPTVSPLWGTSDKRLALAKGRPCLVFGNDGAGKTNLVGLVVAHALGVLDGNLLGYPVAKLDEGESVLMLAFDGPEETRQSFARFNLTEDTPRLVVFAASPPWNPDDANADTLPGFVSAIEEETGQTFALVVVDNAQRAYGAVDQALRAAVFGNALNRLEGEGRSVLVLAQSRKNGKPTSKDDAMLGSLGLSGMGSIVSLHRLKQGALDGSKPTTAELRHHKGIGSDSAEATVVSFNLATGRATLEGEGPSDELLERVAQLPEVGTFTATDAAKLWNLTDRQARRLLSDEAKPWNLVTLDHEGARNSKHWRRAL